MVRVDEHTLPVASKQTWHETELTGLKGPVSLSRPGSLCDSIVIARFDLLILYPRAIAGVPQVSVEPFQTLLWVLGGLPVRPDARGCLVIRESCPSYSILKVHSLRPEIYHPSHKRMELDSIGGKCRERASKKMEVSTEGVYLLSPTLRQILHDTRIPVSWDSGCNGRQ